MVDVTKSELNKQQVFLSTNNFPGLKYRKQNNKKQPLSSKNCKQNLTQSQLKKDCKQTKNKRNLTSIKKVNKTKSNLNLKIVDTKL